MDSINVRMIAVAVGKRCIKCNYWLKQVFGKALYTASIYAADSRIIRKHHFATSKESEKNIEKEISDVYQKLTQRDHILKRPDAYIGSVSMTTQNVWIYDKTADSMKFRSVTYNPGLLNIFEEILINAIDHKQRCKEMSVIKVDVNKETNTISIYNDGDGIPVVVHQEYHMYIPSMIFGQLLSGTNFSDTDKKVTGGRNGYGAKLANIYSLAFRVETVANQKRFIQTFSDHMRVEEPPKITKATKSKEYTQISFQPDLSLFKMKELDEDIIEMMHKRVVDAAGVTDDSVKVYWNGERIHIRSFSDYVELYNKTIQKDSTFMKANKELAEDTLRIDSQVIYGSSPRWQYAVIPTPSSDILPFNMSFVNGVNTTRGGKHMNYIIDQILSHVQPAIEKRLKRSVKPSLIKQHLCVFCNCLIENPSFDSQTKECLMTTSKDFGSTVEIAPAFISKLMKSNLVDYISDAMRIKDSQVLKKSSGSKSTRILGIPKLDDANNAGTRRSSDATLIITEGDSAKALAVGGLGVVGRDNYGVFPLKGKVLNVRDVSEAKCAENEEIQNLVRILGLKYGKEYTDTSSLRYGKLLVMADQDYDGSHIKGLVLNLFETFWPSLLRLNYVSQFITPIVKVSKKQEERMFFTMKEFLNWLSNCNEKNAWRIKYYKGLGTSTAKEGKEYFSNLQSHIIPFASISKEEEDMMDMCFGSKRCEERKEWINHYDENDYVDYAISPLSISSFINKELIQYSRQDCIRSIPSMVDGLKPSQRKVLFGCMKRNLTKEIKVIQLSGYISENVLYHHGEQSLNSTIVSMAQDFVGSNNINLLVPNGQFGTRIMGGKDSASPRYIYTYLSPITSLLFRSEDNALLPQQDEEGMRIEPKYYLPILPMVLVNGATGIGTGWSTTVMNHNPIEIVKQIKAILNDDATTPILPWYRGFVGSFKKRNETSYTVMGNVAWINDTTLCISELPIGKWTQEYKQFLCDLLQQNSLISGFRENHTDTEVLFTLNVHDDEAKKWREDKDKMIKDLKMTSVMSTTNYYLFNSEGHITHYHSADAILEEFVAFRLPFYQQRKEVLLKALEERSRVLTQKERFVESVIDGSLVIRNRKQSDIKLAIEKLGIVERGDSAMIDSLLSIPLSGLTEERIQELKKEVRATEESVTTLQGKTSKDLWMDDLDAFQASFLDMERRRLCELVSSNKHQTSVSRKVFTVDNYNTSQVIS